MDKDIGNEDPHWRDQNNFSSAGSLFDTSPINPVLDATLSARLVNNK